MASLSNINGLFDVHSTGAILFSTSHGTSGQILRSNGNAAPTWVAASTVIGGPYLPLTGGTLSGPLSGTSLTLSGTLAGTSATFTSDTGLIVYSSTAGVGANITFSDIANRTQLGSISYFHLDTASYGSGNAFVITGDQATMTILADGKLMYKEGVYLKPATGTGAGTRKDNLWDAAYNDKITGLAVAGTTTKTLTATQQDGGTLTASWTDNDSGGTVTGTGANTQVAFWTGTSVIDGSSSLKWDNTNFRLGIGITPTYALDIYNSTGTTSSNDGTTLQRLWNYVGGDLQQQKTFIDFVFQDGNDNEYPQVRIGAEVGQNGNADTQLKEGSGAFVVYTNNATTSVPGTNSLTERMRVDYAGNVGIGTSSPGAKLEIAETVASTDCVVRIKATRDAYLQFSPANTTKWALIADYPAVGDFTTYNYPNNFSAIVCKDNKNITTNLAGGNFGIGEINPSEKLEVAGRIKIISTGGAHLILNGDTNNSGDTGEQDAIIDFLGDGDPGLFGFRINSENYGGATAMNFQEYLNGSYSSRLYINKDGYTKIKNDGDTTWDGYNFHAITQSAASEPTVMIYNDNTGGNNYGINVVNRSTSSNTTGRFFLGATNNGATEKIKIYTNGNIQNTNNSYTQLSDLSLKENVVDATDKLEEVKKLRVINWNFIGDDLKQIGVAAQEVEQIFPGLVDEVEHTQDGETSMVKSVKYSVFVPILIKAIQELETRVKELENK